MIKRKEPYQKELTVRSTSIWLKAGGITKLTRLSISINYPRRKCPTVQSPHGATPSSFTTASSELTTRTLRALSYGGGALAVQSFWWVSRNAVWLRYPILVPAVIATIVFSGAIPSAIDDWVLEKLTIVGGHVVHVVAQVSKTWLGDPLSWIALMCTGIIFWWW